MLPPPEPRIQKAAQDCRTPKRFAMNWNVRKSGRFWSAAVLCRFHWSTARWSEWQDALYGNTGEDAPYLNLVVSISTFGFLSVFVIRHSSLHCRYGAGLHRCDPGLAGAWHGPERRLSRAGLSARRRIAAKKDICRCARGLL